MSQQIDAIYENGVLRPLEPLALPERKQVRLTVSTVEDEEWMDVEFMDSCADDADSSIPLSAVRLALAKIPGSMDQAVNEIRGEH